MLPRSSSRMSIVESLLKAIQATIFGITRSAIANHHHRITFLVISSMTSQCSNLIVHQLHLSNNNKLKGLLFSIASLNCNGLVKAQGIQNQSNFHTQLILSNFQYNGLLRDSHLHRLCKLYHCTFSSISPYGLIIAACFFFLPTISCQTI